jgi:hypothetical protein
MNEQIENDGDIGFRNLYGEWITEKGTEFRISGGKGMCFITFHKTYTWGKKKGEIKHFVHEVGGGEFYFEMDHTYYELMYIREQDTIELKACSYCSRKKYEPDLPRV